MGGTSWVDMGPLYGGKIGARTGVSEEESHESLWEQGSKQREGPWASPVVGWR